MLTFASAFASNFNIGVDHSLHLCFVTIVTDRKGM